MSSPVKKINVKRLDPTALETITRERPYVLQVIQTQILYDIAGMLDELSEQFINLRQDFEATIPKGVFEPLTVPVTDSKTILEPPPKGRIETMPWISSVICNDGPDDVYMIVNKGEIPKPPIPPGEQIEVDMKKPQLKKLTFFCLSGENASVRIYAIK